MLLFIYYINNNILDTMIDIMLWVISQKHIFKNMLQLMHFGLYFEKILKNFENIMDIFIQK